MSNSDMNGTGVSISTSAITCNLYDRPTFPKACAPIREMLKLCFGLTIDHSLNISCLGYLSESIIALGTSIASC